MSRQAGETAGHLGKQGCARLSCPFLPLAPCPRCRAGCHTAFRLSPVSSLSTVGHRKHTFLSCTCHFPETEQRIFTASAEMTWKEGLNLQLSPLHPLRPVSWLVPLCLACALWSGVGRVQSPCIGEVPWRGRAVSNEGLWAHSFLTESGVLSRHVWLRGER